MKLHWWCKQIYRKILRWGGIVLFQRIEHDTAAHFQGDSSADSRPLPFKPYIWFILRLEWCGPQKEWSDFVHFSWYYAFLLTLLIVFFLCFTLCVMDKCLYLQCYIDNDVVFLCNYKVIKNEDWQVRSTFKPRIVRNHGRFLVQRCLWNYRRCAIWCLEMGQNACKT